MRWEGVAPEHTKEHETLSMSYPRTQAIGKDLTSQMECLAACLLSDVEKVFIEHYILMPSFKLDKGGNSSE